MGHHHGYDGGCGMPMGGYGCGDMGMGYGYGPMVAPVSVAPSGGFATGFALVLVLFILLVIIGAAWAAY